MSDLALKLPKSQSHLALVVAAAPILAPDFAPSSISPVLGWGEFFRVENSHLCTTSSARRKVN
jgi:hypothetical protein